MSEPLAHLDERPLAGGLAWIAEGPRGRLWVIAWNPEKDRSQVRAWPAPAGRIAHWGDASGIDEARAEAGRIAALIAAGKAA